MYGHNLIHSYFILIRWGGISSCLLYARYFNDANDQKHPLEGYLPTIWKHMKYYLEVLLIA